MSVLNFLQLVFFSIGYLLNLSKSASVQLSSLPSEQLTWFQAGLDDLKNAVKQSRSLQTAKNVILFVGDGMGPSTVTAARIYKAKEEGELIWERFPHMGLLKVRFTSSIISFLMSSLLLSF